MLAPLAWLCTDEAGSHNGIRIVALERSLAKDGAPSAMAQLRNPMFLVSWLTRVGIALGVIFLMTVKPGALVSVLAVVVAAAAGAALGLGLTSGRFTREGQVA